jgi:hypothetical protein
LRSAERLQSRLDACNTGRLRTTRVATPAVADNMIFNPKPGSAVGLADSMADEHPALIV